MRDVFQVLLWYSEYVFIPKIITNTKSRAPMQKIKKTMAVNNIG